MPLSYLVGEGPTVADAILLAALAIVLQNLAPKQREEKSVKYYNLLTKKHVLDLPSLDTAGSDKPKAAKKPRRDPTNIV